MVLNVFSRSSIAMTVVTLLINMAAVTAFDVMTNCKPGYVALTFDDGPGLYTSKLIDILNENRVRATFFVNGENVLNLQSSDTAQNALKKAYDSNHQIASHTWSHRDLNTLGSGDFNSEIDKIEDLIYDLIDARPAFIRPPYGAANDDTISKIGSKGYTVVMWSTDTKDYESHNLRSEMDRLKKSITSSSKGYIVLAHDIYEQTSTELTIKMIEYIRSKGLKFCTVAECVGRSAYK
ncbi:hypothetical protein BDB01DRAFT_746090 [Pilobolus umbonatus]|nr:hypothetical protein BDB01DRAFT_746090 [Pilobolus umbonatus]